MAYHLQTNGQTECQNQMVEHYLRVFTNFQQDDWARWLLLAQHIYNNFIYSVTRMMLMEALMTFCADLRINVSLELPESNAPQAQE